MSRHSIETTAVLYLYSSSSRQPCRDGLRHVSSNEAESNNTIAGSIAIDMSKETKYHDHDESTFFVA